METLKYKVIKTEKQYDEYCRILHDLDFSNKKTKKIEEEIDLLTVLIEKYDEEHNIFDELDPVELLRSLMKDHQLKSVDLAKKFKVSPGLISDIINYKKGFSKDIIRQLAALFKLSQEAFNRPYKLKIPENSHFRNASVMNTKKKLAVA
ncbi:MAG: transcriptional regulator [Chitinophagaceae bacterium]|nr:transcriptional regulator [Chitinophagaceae bacterium]